MIEFKTLNDAEFDDDGWDILDHNISELFKFTNFFTEEEIQFAKSFMNVIQVEREDQIIIEFRALPVHFYHFVVNAFRKMKHFRSQHEGEYFS